MQRFILLFLLSYLGLIMLFLIVEEVKSICRVGSFWWVSRAKE